MNENHEEPATVTVQLKRGVAVLDADVYEKIKAGGYNMDLNQYGYVRITNYNGDGRHVFLHRYVMGLAGRWEMVDHINGVKHDNRRSNLRRCTMSENTMNSRLSRANSSGFKGVSWHKKAKCWRAYLMVNYKQIYLGHFSDVNEAAEAVRKAREHYHGAFCNHGTTDSPEST